ncbi:MAG: phosphatidate cytidylyltransferase [Planctomycetes bacterium]|nr:phosphatidate cytidylyltransferase [Planctomycetota bacterium]
MLTTRLWMGAILVALTAGMLFLDQKLAPVYPFLFMFVVGLGLLACRELIQLLGPNRRPHVELCYGGIVLMGAANLLAQMPWRHVTLSPHWEVILGLFVVQLLLLFVREMSSFTEPGRRVERMALTLWIIAYLGVAPCFLMQLRWLFTPVIPLFLSTENLHLLRIGSSEYESLMNAGAVALALAIFVPKACDIGAYCTGRMIGRHRMTPVLSPKKTWEGAFGGLVLASLAAIGINRLSPVNVLPENFGIEIAFGLTIGIAGMFGDLAESLIKRDCEQKDASKVVPGFGGVLDVVDSVIFSAPVSYFFIVLFSPTPLADELFRSR